VNIHSTLILLAGMLSSQAACACGVSPSFAVIHSALPDPLPEGAFVAEVEIKTKDQWQLYATGLRAYVTKTIVGTSQVERVILRLPVAENTSCDAPFANGRSGIIVGIPEKRKGKALVVWPVLVSRYDGFTLSGVTKLTKSPQR
jgi:hypothetical protein